MVQDQLTIEFMDCINNTIEMVKTKGLDWKTAASDIFNNPKNNIKMFNENQPQIRNTEFYYYSDLKEDFFNKQKNREYFIYIFSKTAKLINVQNLKTE
jgi:hypothetical protein